MSPANSAALLVRKRSILDNLRDVTGARLAATFTGLEHYTDDERWIALVSPVVTAAQQRAASTQIAYLEARLGTRLRFDLGSILDRAAVDLSQPFIALANALSTGSEFAEAVVAGASRAEGVGESSVTYASRAANTVADRRVSGWERVPSGGACDWCIEVSGQIYHSAESASFGHDRCSCDVEPST